jgi:serine/threonine-protein kinase RsbW
VSRGNLLLRMELRSDPEMLCAVRGALTQLAEKLGFPEADCRAVVLAVDEALTNIIRHTYGGQTEHPIEALFRRISLNEDALRGEGLEIVLEDRGPAVDREKLCGRPLEEVRPGGLGLHFIRQSMDRVEFRRDNGRNQLHLVKLLHKPEPQKGS